MEKKIAIISDIHGNYSALQAVCKEIDQDTTIEQIYCLGDLIGIGYETNKVLDLLLSRSDISFVMGNHDEAIVDILSGREPYSRKRERDHHEWIAAHIDQSFLSFLSELPVTLSAECNGKRLDFVHYHLDEEGNFLPVDYDPTVEKLDFLYRDSAADIICFGHHHVIHHFKTKKRLYLNPGSLGCFHKPLASYAILIIGDHGEINVTFKEVPYDNKEFLLGYSKLNVPGSDYILKVFHGNQPLHYQ
ncbi:metallophosphoesterase family protein [Bacillus sp. S3]|uniref:metallophosphoesterase family protein n=1 Tax=Bacillus sp. S3 TaxID=486398 RepID=UPI00118CC85B|nr:metallophosphoesterase family protein [Bacillus sp. S3]QCJ42473.1 metallophosphoesterase family protein [Bacillus sp. S3]